MKEIYDNLIIYNLSYYMKMVLVKEDINAGTVGKDRILILEIIIEIVVCFLSLIVFINLFEVVILNKDVIVIELFTSA